MIENKTGIHLCTVCDCKNEHYIFPDDFNEEQVIKANKLFRDFKKLFNKYDLNQSNIEIMDLVILIMSYNN
ncbi:MAG: hypothetical protein IJ086_04865 [Clostridium sp.]|nr:hypothetical protein [Clostridium sp.]